MADTGARVKPLTDSELLVLGIAVNAGFVKRRPPGRSSAEALEELSDAGLLRRTERGYVPTDEGRRVAAVIPDG